MDPTTSLARLAFDAPAGLSIREFAVGSFLVLAILYLVFDAFRSGPRRDRKGRFRSKRRSQLVDLLKLGVVVAILWLGASIGGVI